MRAACALDVEDVDSFVATRASLFDVAGDNDEIMDSSSDTSDSVRFGYGTSMGRDARRVSCVRGAGSCRGSIAGALEVPGEPSSSASPFTGLEGLGGTT